MDVVNQRAVKLRITINHISFCAEFRFFGPARNFEEEFEARDHESAVSEFGELY
jgi:hypothetical protein